MHFGGDIYQTTIQNRGHRPLPLFILVRGLGGPANRPVLGRQPAGAAAKADCRTAITTGHYLDGAKRPVHSYLLRGLCVRAPAVQCHPEAHPGRRGAWFRHLGLRPGGEPNVRPEEKQDPDPPCAAGAGQ